VTHRYAAVAPVTSSVTVRVPAKVNLHLSVGPLRSDGYHELTTVYQAVSLYDEVTLAPARRLTVSVDGESAGDVPVGADNLAARAVHQFAALTGRPPAVSIRIRKGIPVAGGMAGGSADAAAALVACDALWGTDLGRDELHGLALCLGSDVPFALDGGCALGTGRGETVTPVLGRGSYQWVLALPDSGLSTPAVYAELDRQRREAGRKPRWPAQPPELLAAIRTGDPAALGAALFNDLQPAALRLRPALGRVLETAAELGAVGSVVSGSGPTVALLAVNEAHAVRLAASLAGAGVTRRVRTASGPVPGARVLDDTTSSTRR
jgi:4-diphosphocytidyl-2-C-methyl-D-erythritol kinase